MFTFKPFAGVALLLLLISSCNNATKKYTEDKSADVVTTQRSLLADQKNKTENSNEIPVNDDLTREDTTTSPSPVIKHTQASPKTSPILALPDLSKKIIKNATVKLEVKDVKSYGELVGGKLKQYGAYISQEDNNISNERTETVMVIKVPVQYFDELMYVISGTDAKVVEKSIRSEDVTGDIADTRSRLEAKKQMRLKYLDFLKESKNMTEVLQVQNEINNIQEEIEAASGRYAVLSTQSAYSTINLTFFKTVTGVPSADTKPGFFGKAGASFKTGVAWVADLLIGLISIWPLLALFAIAIFIYKKKKPAKVMQ